MALSISSVQVIGRALPFWGDDFEYGSCLGTASAVVLGNLGIVGFWEMRVSVDSKSLGNL